MVPPIVYWIVVEVGLIMHYWHNSHNIMVEEEEVAVLEELGEVGNSYHHDKW
jgi:hypothetical protein